MAYSVNDRKRLIADACIRQPNDWYKVGAVVAGSHATEWNSRRDR